jgi:hypothetical protein
MRSFWSDPYLWIHLSGLSVVPIFLELSLLGFAVGDPILPEWLELFLISAVGVAPILWMQWQRPFYIFSLVAVAIKPEQLTDDQRRLLTLFKSQRNRILAAALPVLLILVLARVYGISSIAIPVAPFSSEWRLLGLLLAAAAFLGVNLFTQVPVSVLGVMLHSDAEFDATTPYPLEQIRQSFSLFGLQVKQILPPIVPDPLPEPAIATSSMAVSELGTEEYEKSTSSELNEKAEPPPNPAPVEPAVEESETAPASEGISPEPPLNPDVVSEASTEDDIWGS